MQHCHAVFQPSYVRLIRFHISWALSSTALCAGVSPLGSTRSYLCAAAAAPLIYPPSDAGGDGVSEGVAPCGGTGFKIVAHRTGAPGAIGAEQALSTDCPVQGRQVDEEAQVLPAPNGGVRFGVYTGPVAAQAALAVPTAPVGAVGR